MALFVSRQLKTMAGRSTWSTEWEKSGTSGPLRPALIRARVALRPAWIVETLGRSLLVVVFEVGGQPVLQLTHCAITDR